VNETATEIKEIVTKFAKDKAGLANATESTSFKNDLGISSASLIDIVLELEDTFGLTIEDDELKQIDTIGAAAALIDAKRGAVAR
jgi:acyl carrier protein